MTQAQGMCQPNDHADASRIATEAGRLLLDLRVDVDRGGLDAAQLGEVGDRRAHELILRRLAEAHPRDAILSEEGADDPARLGAPRTWVVDPLDGTREFAERGRSDWAVHVALVVDGAPVAAAVALPARALTLSTMRPPLLSPSRPRPTVVVSRTRAPAIGGAVRAALDAELVALGSAGAKAMAVVLGEADVYVHAGGQWEWDSAARRLPAPLQPSSPLPPRPSDLPPGAGQTGSGCSARVGSWVSVETGND
jgi:3'(2'), 5'-bisphosphate nucleotidase